MKPKLRGWLHLATAPLTVAAGIVLIALSPTAPTRIGSAVYTLSAVLLFTVSAVYHRGHWSPRVHGFLRRFDHANIFLLIAGSYTPFTLLLLEGTQRVVLLSGDLVGRACSACCSRSSGSARPSGSTSRSTSGMGWVAVFFIPAFDEGSHRSVSGSARPSWCSSSPAGRSTRLGGVVYGIKRPNPWPRWFGFHEVFHSLTILAFVTHYVGVSLATYSLR